MLQRVGNGLSQYAHNSLDKLFDRISGDLARLRVVSAPQSQRVKRIAEYTRTVRRRVRETYRGIYKYTRGGLAIIGAQQADWARQQLGRVLPFPIKPGNFGINATKRFIDSEPIVGNTLSDWYDNAGVQTVSRVRRGVRTGIAAGDNAEAITARIQGQSTRTGRIGGVQAISKRDTTTIARSSVHTISNKAHMQVFRDNPDLSPRFRFTAVLDSRTSLICLAHDGLEYEYDDPNAKIPPLHPNCRSTIVPLIDWEDLGLDCPPHVKQTRPSPKGPIQSDETYSDWLRRQDPPTQNRVLGPKRADLFRQDKLDLRELVRGDLTTVPLKKLDK